MFPKTIHAWIKRIQSVLIISVEQKDTSFLSRDSIETGGAPQVVVMMMAMARQQCMELLSATRVPRKYLPPGDVYTLAD